MNNLEELKKKYAELGAEIERLEKQKENKRWRGEYNNRYYTVDSYGDVCDSCEANDKYDNYKHFIRNYFKTEEEAKEYLEKINTYYELMDLAEELNNGEEIDWGNAGQDKYYLICNSEKINLSKVYTLKTIGTIYCLNVNFLEIAKERIGEERLIKLFK